MKNRRASVSQRLFMFAAVLAGLAPLFFKIPQLLHCAPQLLSQIDSAADIAIASGRLNGGTVMAGYALSQQMSAQSDTAGCLELRMNGDFCDQEGARKLKQKIEEYWASRGFDVSINLVDAGFVPAMRSARTDVRSNMVNGMPPRKKGARPAEAGKPASYLRGIG